MTRHIPTSAPFVPDFVTGIAIAFSI